MTGTRTHIWEIFDVKRESYLGFGKLDSLAFSPDGMTLAVGRRWPRPSVDSVGPGTIALRHVVTGKHKDTLRFDGIPTSLAFSPDGYTLACGTLYEWGGFDTSGWVTLWDVVTRAEKHQLSPRQFDNRIDIIHSVTYSPDNRTVAAGGEKDIYVWDAVTRAPIRILEGHLGVVNKVAFSPDRRTLASGSSDGTVLLWEINPLTEPLPDVTPQVVNRLRVAPDVDGDGGVDVQDLMLVAAHLGQSAQTPSDVNGDKIVNILDVVLVAGMVDNLTGDLPMYPDSAVMPRTN